MGMDRVAGTRSCHGRPCEYYHCLYDNGNDDCDEPAPPSVPTTTTTTTTIATTIATATTAASYFCSTVAVVSAGP